MRCIYKFEIPGGTSTQLRVPLGWQPITVQVQHGKVYIWAVIDPTATQYSRSVLCINTGARFDDKVMERFRYLGTIQLDGGDFVQHVFVEK